MAKDNPKNLHDYQDIKEQKAVPGSVEILAAVKSDTGFLKAFNAALAKHLGSEKMLAAVKEYDYTKAQLPGDGTTAFACANR